MRSFLSLMALASAGCNCGGNLHSLEGTIEISPRSIDFGEARVGSASTRELSLANRGRVALELDEVKLTSDARASFEVSSAPKSIAPGEVARVTVTYRPRAVGLDNAAIIVPSDDRAAPEILVSLAGHAVTIEAFDAGADSGRPDAGPPDAGPPDAGPPDAGRPDAGSCAGILQPSPASPVWRSAGAMGIPRIVTSGTGFAAVWSDAPTATADATIRLALFDASGNVLSAQAIGSAQRYGGWERVDFSGSEYGIVDTDERTGTNRVYFRRANAAGTMIAGSELQFGAGGNQMPQVAWSPVAQQWGIAYEELDFNSRTRVHLVRVDSAGQVVAGSDQMLTLNGMTNYYQLSRSFIWAGESWAVAFAEGDTLMLREISPSGIVGPPIVIEPGATRQPIRASLAFDGVSWGVVWLDDRAGTGPMQIRFALVRPGGAGYVQGSDTLVAADPAYEPDIVFDGVSFVVTWHGYSGGMSNVHVAHVSRSGSVIDDLSMWPVAAPYANSYPSIAANGCVHAITTMITTSAGGEARIGFAR